LVCSGNKLTNLNLSSGNNLEILYCSNNNLTNLSFLNNLNEEKLTYLDIGSNNITSDLIPFSRFINLKELCLNSNPIHGSLEPLKNMSKLEKLSISDTDINSGLEYLSESIETFYCSANQRKNVKVKTIYNLFTNNQGEVKTE
jgi:Leucine-rich repeat (LRR) protein